jgi:hypothetical protein
MSKIRLLILPLLLALLFMPVVSTAQTDPQISSLEIAIWPEYDRPAALVIYQVRLADDVDTPAVVTLPIPGAAGDPHAVAAWHPDGTLDDIVTWTATRQGEWTMIEVTTNTNGVWLEFYEQLTIAGDQRAYTFTRPVGLAVDALSFDVLHPVGAKDLRISPEGEVRKGSDGLNHTHLNLGASRSEQPFAIELSYTKPTAYTGELPVHPPNPTLSQFEVALWPEYDQPSTLVIYRGGLSPEVPLPATVSLPIPESAGEPNAVAVLGDDDRLYLVEHERRVEGHWAWITFEYDGSAFQLEYYDDLVFDGDSRSYTFTWPGSVETGAFTYELQEPIGASLIEVTPAGVAQAESDGLVYIRSDLGPQQPGSPLTISFQYEKKDTELTADAVTSAPTIDRPSTTQGGTPDLRSQLPFILGGFGLLLVTVGVFLYLRMQRQERASRKRPRKRKRKPEAQRTSADLDTAVVFCHVCGSKANASDHFCRSCGTKLRQ